MNHELLAVEKGKAKLIRQMQLMAVHIWARRKGYLDNANDANDGED